jgi:predicted nuclease with TOPRIM domain
MSVKPKVDERLQSESEHSTESNQVNVNEVLERIKALEATNARLLDESKKTKSKYQDAVTQYENVDRERLEKEGNFQALLEKEVGKSNTLQSEMIEMKKKVLSSNIRSTVQKFSSDVYDVDDLLNQPNFSHILKSGIDETTYSISEEKVKEYVNEVLKAKPYMRKAPNVPNTVDTKPQFQTGEGKTKSLDELSSAELEKIIASRFQ